MRQRDKYLGSTLAALLVAAVFVGVPAMASGASWVLQSSPSPGSEENYLNGVSCSSSTACTAVGEYATGKSTTDYVTLAERWNGTVWATQTTPNPEGQLGSHLTGVSCPSSTVCIAVGHYVTSAKTEAALAERWNGTEWSIQSVPAPEGTSSPTLLGISCASSTSCIAVGSVTNTTLKVRVPLAESWNGTAWSAQAAVNPTGNQEATQSGVSCSSSTACTAVGTYRSAANGEATLAERWNGTVWSIQTTPNVGTKERNVLRGVSCPSATACTAVGFDLASGRKPLAEAWNGTEWSIQSTPALTGSGELLGVSCASSTACEAVGENETKPLGEAWNGTEWSKQTMASGKEATSNELLGVSCISSTVCEAVGQYVKEARLTLAERYS
jgi:hypothetical protein